MFVEEYIVFGVHQNNVMYNKSFWKVLVLKFAQVHSISFV